MTTYGKHRIFTSPITTKPLEIDSNGKFREKDTGRIFHMHGINFACNTKMPKTPKQTTDMRPDDCGFFNDADTVTFVGKPFPLSEGYQHITRIKQCGFNTIRFVTTWEAIEHEGPGIYDLEYVQYVADLLKMIDEVGGLYVFIDPHQDVWSRFTGGSGAPLWTLYAAGLEPRNFEATFAAKLHNFASDPSKYTKMVWATNYTRLASAVMFTMFFSGSIFTPKAKINDQNIQDYLQYHFIEAYAFLMDYLKSQVPDLFNTCLLGIESMNEPNSGFYGFGDLNQFPPDQQLRLDESPNPIQSLRLGMGISEEVDVYSLTLFGPTKVGKKWCRPEGKAWVSELNNKDKIYGFKRSPEWKLGECIFAQHGVWDSISGELILPDYFRVHPETGEFLNEDKFINGPFLDFWSNFKKRMREIDANMFLIIQPPVLQIPPKIKNNDEYLDDRTMVAVHYYDGMSLMFQKWNRLMNVDTVGILRGKYFNPIFGLVLGESNIRKSIREQLKSLADECYQNVGYNIPVVFSETGMPFNMDNKKSYEDGNYESQEGANDAILSALENEQLNFTYWCYNPDNCHDWGDLWNLEDFSIWSRDDLKGQYFYDGNDYMDWLINNCTKRIITPNVSGELESVSSDTSIDKQLIRETIYNYNKGDENKYTRSSSGGSTSTGYDALDNMKIDLTDGVRAAKAILRPIPILNNGDIVACQFDISTKVFHLEIENIRYSIGDDFAPDIIIIPEFHYCSKNYRIRVSSGIFEIRQNPITQWIEWDYSNSTDKLVTMDIELLCDMEDEVLLKNGGCGGALKALACGYL